MRTVFLGLMLLTALPAWAQIENENLLVTLPDGYKVGYQSRQAGIVQTEMVPNNETVEGWTEMVTTQIFLGMKASTPEQFQDFMRKQWASSCRDGGFSPIARGEENGYPFALWVLTCQLNAATGKPENTWFKAIKGNDSFYLVQKAFKFDPSKKQVAQWMQYFRKVVVCDSRLPDRSCPTAK